MCCYDCCYLKQDNKKEGKVNGAVYYCSKQKKYVSGTSEGCDKHEHDVLKNSSVRDEIYNNGVHYSNNDVSIGGGVTLIVLLLLLKIILTLLGYD